MQHRRTKWVWIDWFFSDVWKWECYTDVRDSKTSPEPHCRVLPPGKFNRRITEPLPIWKKVSRESLRHFSRNVANKHSCKQSCKHTRSKTTATQAINNITNLTLYGHIKTAEQRTIIQQYGTWLVHWPLRGGPAQSPPRCTKCNSPPINDQCTNFILFDVAL